MFSSLHKVIKNGKMCRSIYNVDPILPVYRLEELNNQVDETNNVFNEDNKLQELKE